MVFRPSTPDDRAQIAALLSVSHVLAPQSTLTNAAEMTWKYWLPYGRDAAPRSYVLERDGTVVAHAGMWPHRLGGEVGGHLFDWVRDPSVPGVGAAIVNRLKRHFDFVFAIGGSDSAKQVMPRLGFAPARAASTYARPLAPWRQARLHQHQDRRLPLRFARNTVWALVPSGGAGSPWTTAEVQASDPLPEVMGNRGSDFVRFLLQCPTVAVRAWHVLHEGQRVGLFALAVVEGQARVLGVWMDAPSVSRWAAAYRLAQQVARELGAVEITARMADDEMGQGAMEAGLRLIERSAVLVYRRGEPVESLTLPSQLWDREAFLLNEGVAFLT